MPRIRPVMPATLMIAPLAVLSGIVGKHDLSSGPANVGSLALVQLAIAAVGDPIEALNRVHHLGIVGEQEFVAIEFHFDRVEHVHRVAFVATNKADELTMTIECCPDASGLTYTVDFPDSHAA